MRMPRKRWPATSGRGRNRDTGQPHCPRPACPPYRIREGGGRGPPGSPARGRAGSRRRTLNRRQQRKRRLRRRERHPDGTVTGSDPKTNVARSGRVPTLQLFSRRNRHRFRSEDAQTVSSYDTRRRWLSRRRRGRRSPMWEAFSERRSGPPPPAFLRVLRALRGETLKSSEQKAAKEGGPEPERSS
jgi:hypothetical protein